MIKFIPLFLWIIFIVIDALYDSKRIKELKTINHVIRFIYRIGAACAFIIAFHLFNDKFISLAYLCFCGVSFWMFFNLLLNKLRELPWSHLGDGYFDSWEKSIGFGTMLLYKSIAIVFFLIAYFVSWASSTTI